MKKWVSLLLILAIALTLFGCAKKVPQTSAATPAGDAYNLIQKQGKKISGFSSGCVGYRYDSDQLMLYAHPDLDWTALFEIMETALDGREINAVSLNWYKAEAPGNGIESLLEAFSLNVTSPVKRLELDDPSMSSGAVAQRSLWRESLERLDFVEEVQFARNSGENNLDYLEDIADGGTIRASFGAAVVSGRNGIYSATDLSGLKVFSGLKRFVLVGGTGVRGFESLDPADTQIDLTWFCGDLDAAKLAFNLRLQGFTVIGISDDPRDDLSAEDAEKYDAYAADRQALSALAKDDMTFSERLERLREAAPRAESAELTEAGITLLRDFYALAGTDAFSEYAAQMCSYDDWTEQMLSDTRDQRLQFAKSPHQYLLTRLCIDLSTRDFERFLAEVVDQLPEAGDWCRAEISVSNTDGGAVKTNALRALMRGYQGILPSGNNQTMSEEQSQEMLDRIDRRGLLWGHLNRRYFTGDAERDIATASALIDAGRVDYEEAYSMLLPGDGDDPDAFLKATTVWDAAYDGSFVRQYPSYDTGLAIEDARFDKTRFARSNSPDLHGKPEGKKALIAYESRDSDALVFPMDAYRWFEDDDGERFRGVLAANTPASVDEAELLIIAWITDYVYVGDYSDGSKGYRCVSDVYAYDIDTGECVARIGRVIADPPESLANGGKKYDVYPNPKLLDLFMVTSSWFGNANGIPTY